jgi:integrase
MKAMMGAHGIVLAIMPRTTAVVPHEHKGVATAAVVAATTLARMRSQADRENAESSSVLSPHVLRHTCAKRLLDADTQLTEVAVDSWA